MPALAVGEAPEREAGRLAFGGLIDGRDVSAQLPLFPEREDGPRCGLLELADWRGGPIMAQGRGAPLDLRLLVAAALWTPIHARAARGRLVVSVRELRDFLYPNGWQRGRDWPRVLGALWRARDYMLPDGEGGWWFPLALRRLPGEGFTLGDTVTLDVEMPPAVQRGGPVIEAAELALLGVESAPRYRAYIAGHSVAWLPGVTRVPHPRNRRFRLWTGDVSRYPVLTREDRRRLAFGAGDAKHRTRREQDGAWEDLPGVEIVTRTASTTDGRRGWIIAPREAAEAIRKREGANRGTGFT